MVFAIRRTLLVTLGILILLGSTLLATGTAGAATTSPARAQAHSATALRWPAVGFGAKGNRVFAIQYLLRQWGYAIGPSGTFGAVTRHDVAHFQRVRGLPGTGVVGSLTWPRLIIPVAFGSRNWAVSGVQQNLHYGYGYKYLPVTGFFSSITRRAVRSFQARYHIGVDGIVGPVTWNTIIRFEK